MRIPTTQELDAVVSWMITAAFVIAIPVVIAGAVILAFDIIVGLIRNFGRRNKKS